MLNKYFENANKMPTTDIEIGKLYKFTRPYVVRNIMTGREGYWAEFIKDKNQWEELNNFVCLEFGTNDKIDHNNKTGGKRIKILFMGERYSMFVGSIGTPPLCEEIK